jgi:hypothetical protein
VVADEAEHEEEQDQGAVQVHEAGAVQLGPDAEGRGHLVVVGPQVAVGRVVGEVRGEEEGPPIPVVGEALRHLTHTVASSPALSCSQVIKQAMGCLTHPGWGMHLATRGGCELRKALVGV